MQTSKPRRARRKTREEKARETYLRILEAAAQVVGEDGYADSSISKITQLAGIAQGTFYNYFETRQQVFDALLPYMGEQMVEYIRTAVPADVQGAARETARLRAFFTYLNAHPVFYRILYEAEVFAPAAHAKHFQILVDGYRGALERAVARGEIEGYDAEELEAIIYILLSARAYLAMRYVRRADDGRSTVPEHVITAYEKLMTRGLYGKPDHA
ncbi:TetR/AcrR family transcriptional regulator [Futiania mangrovi]|uniref:TetR/AcrR family transcriptional regulator n=1 Tax=Futiania mangrovi TaxID=2959716 RepID=A0A9J6PHG7_9PROT|nr:TetR/AcrR family transcriptional regulator [Futiania mangrovii]MCP1337256.1 TetR/AcrR family transcriptional regulator [Futiania mangrovii]